MLIQKLNSTKVRLLSLLLMLGLGCGETMGQVQDVANQVVTKVTGTATATLKTGQWYLMYNRGRAAYNYEYVAETTIKQSTATLMAGDDVTAENAGYLFQLESAGSTNTYYIMTGHGHWLCDVTESSAVVRTTTDVNERGAFTFGKCVSSGHWWLKSASGYVIDGNGNGSTAVGYGTTVPTKVDGNNDHSFYAVTLGSAEGLTGAALVNRQLKSGGIFRFASQRTTTMSITDPADHKLVSQTTKKDDPSQWWLVEPLATGGIAMRNYATGLYAQSTNGGSVQYTTAAGRSTLYAKASATATATKPLVTISSKSNFGDKSCMHDDASHKVVNWTSSNSAGENPASDWAMTAVEGFTPDQVRDHFEEVSGTLSPANGITVQIRNVETGCQIAEDASGKLLAPEAAPADFSQYWVMEAGSDGRYAFRNVKTGHYFSYTSGTGNGSVQTASGSKKSYYTLKETSDQWQRTYHISGDANGQLYFTHTFASNAPTGTPQPYVVNTATDEAMTHWIFVRTELSAEEIEEQQLAYQSYTEIKNNVSSYTTKMNEYFTDSSYSELKENYQSMTDDELRNLMKKAGLNEYLIRIALKVKNDTWAQEDEMSREFRVNDYQVYSHYLFSRSKVGMSNCFGRLSNPTGITVKPGDIVSIFCDRAAPSGSELQLELVQGTEASGTTVTLNKGINIFSFAEEATLFIFYQIKDTNVSTKLSTCPDVRIHIEGGQLQGYYDKTRGHTNATWKHLRTKLLKHSNVLNIKTKNLVFCFNNELVQKACTTDMERLLKAWDDMVDIENELMGYNDTFIPGISEVQRNIYNFFSKPQYIGGLMMAGLNGVQAMESAIPSIMNPDDMCADGIWGPAHECGHLRQYLIQMMGTLESSNNLFSNVVVYKQGRTTQRSAAPQTVFDHFASHTPWVNYGLWETTRMLYQFYLYYHVNGIMPDFYPRVFAQMRKSPMDQNDRANLHGGEEYLKLARTFCDVAQADLSEMFAAYGFFEPVSNFTLSEGGIMWGMNTTQEEIDATLEYMHKYPKKLGNILFIEDRVQPVLATYEGHKEGEYKKRRGDDQLNGGSAGDVGQYTAYMEEPSLTDYYYTITSAGKVTIHGEGATGLVGFKVYDQNGKLAYLSNYLTFTLPAELRSQDFKLVAAMGDGTDIQLTTDLPEGIASPATTHSHQGAAQQYDLQGRSLPHTSSAGLIISKGQKVLK